MKVEFKDQLNPHLDLRSACVTAISWHFAIYETHCQRASVEDVKKQQRASVNVLENGMLIKENVGGVSQSDKARYEPDLFLTFQRWIAVALPQSVNDLSSWVISESAGMTPKTHPPWDEVRSNPSAGLTHFYEIIIRHITLIIFIKCPLQNLHFTDTPWNPFLWSLTTQKPHCWLELIQRWALICKG